MTLPILDIERFCRERGLDYATAGHHHCHAGWVQVHCTFCAGGVSGFHLGFSLSRGNMNCWRCGGHSAWAWVGEVLATKRSDLIRAVFTKHAREGQVNIRQIEALSRRKLEVPKRMGPLLPKHKTYLTGRGFSPKRLAEEWDLQGTAHLSGTWSWRVVGPIWDVNGRVVAYLGRSIRKGFKPKYKVTDKERCLADPRTFVYGINKVPGDSVVIVEGPADAWKLGPGAVALLGIDWKREQANLLRHFKRRFVMFDPERIAQKRAERLASYLSMFPGETEIIDGLRTDPGDMSRGKAARVMRELGVMK